MSTAAAPRSQTMQAILMMACAAATIAVLWALLRYASQTMHPLYMVFWRSLFGVLLLAPVFMRNGISSLRTKRLPLHALRSLFGLLAMIGIFYAIATVELTQAMAINYSAPLFATLGAVLVLGEPVRWRRITAVIIGFAGMLVVVRPHVGDTELGVLAAVMGAIAMAGSLLCIKKLSATEPNATIIVYGNTISLPFAFVIALFFWQWPTWFEFGLLVGVGILSTTSQLFLNRALSLAETGAVLPVDFLRLVFITILGAVFFAEQPDFYDWIGAGIILFSTVYIARREAMLDTEPTIRPQEPG